MHLRCPIVHHSLHVLSQTSNQGNSCAVMQLESGVVLHMIHDDGRLSIWLDGELRLDFDDIWCIPDRADSRFCTHEAEGSGTEFGVLQAGGSDSVTVALLHLRVYDFAMPVDDLGAEAICGEYGGCAAFGLPSVVGSKPASDAPENPFVEPGLRLVAGAHGPSAEAVS